MADLEGGWHQTGEGRSVAGRKQPGKPGSKGGCGCLAVFLAVVLALWLIGTVADRHDESLTKESPSSHPATQTRSEKRNQQAASECSPFYGDFVTVATEYNPDRIICERVDHTFVALAFGDRDRRWWRTVRRGGRWATTSVAQRGAVAIQVPPPPVTYAPPPVTYAPPDNPVPDPGYNGPRCYAPGGGSYTPC